MKGWQWLHARYDDWRVAQAFKDPKFRQRFAQDMADLDEADVLLRLDGTRDE